MFEPTPTIPPALHRGVFGWDAVKLSDAYTASELAAAIQQIYADPASENPARAHGSIRLYSKKASRRLDALAWAVTYHLQQRTNRRAAG